jgi:hypothetical protein
MNWRVSELFDPDAIADQVRRNCSICDARHAGLFSVCGLAMRLRDLYKWEKGLDPWVEKEAAEILEWIGAKEETWERLEEKEFMDISINGTKYDPFDALAINAVLKPQGLYYGAGYVHSLRPSFFLALIEERNEIEGCAVYRLGRELARDLLPLPALSQGDFIVIRKESARLFLWNQIFFIRKSGRCALGFALKEYGLKEYDEKVIQGCLESILEDELENYIYHEVGEIKGDVFSRDVWREVIAAFPHTPVELFARAVKDLLADTNEYGKLPHIVRERKAGSLAFHVAFLDGLAKELFPEIAEVFREFMNTRNWMLIEQAIAIGFNRAKDYAEMISTIFQRGKRKGDMKGTQNEIERRLLVPLGVLKAKG